MDKPPHSLPYWLLTVGYLAVAFGWIVYTGSKPGAVPLRLDELGTLLAGMFSPLAFLWFLYTARAQRAELDLQRDELRQNNVTQAEQRLEMQRQATALEAQIRASNAQADASYQPILLLDSFSGAGGEQFEVQIKNVGAPVLDASCDAPFYVQTLITPAPAVGHAIHGNVLSFWPRDHHVRIRVDERRNGPTTDFVMRVTRLDLKKKLYTLRLIHDQQRLEVAQIDDAQ